jgi:hypothetical protein
MTWVKLDDGLWRHRKIRKAWKEPRAVGMYVLALCHCNEENASEENNGFVDADWVELMLPAKPERDRVTGTLEDLGLWEPRTGGWQIHDYLDYQPDHHKVLEIREARRFAGSLGGKAKANGRQHA